MARKRMIDPRFWGDKHINKLGVYARYMFIGIVSNADDDGYIEAELSQLQRLIFGFDIDKAVEIQQAYNELKSFKALHFYEVDGDTYAHLLNWEKHQTQRDDRRQPSQIPKCPLCKTGNVQPVDGHMTDTRPSSDGHMTAEVKLSQVKKSKVKLSKEKEVVVANATTPQFKSKQIQESWEFFNNPEKQEAIIQEILSTGLNEKFVRNEIKSFLIYWLAETRSGKLKWEKQDTFMLRGRLATWFKNQIKWDNQRQPVRNAPKGKNYD